jgi:hypothetical protein
MVEILARHLRKHPLPSGRVVEPFAGSGRLIAGLRDAVPVDRWHAIEIDPRYRGALEDLGVEHTIGDSWLHEWPGNVVTNPPFGRSLTPTLMRVLDGLGKHSRVACVLCAHRSLVERDLMPPPSEVLHPRWRPCYGGASAGLPGTCWAIWRPGHAGPTAAYYIDHPERAAQVPLL